jgi:Fe-S cluster assembly scaffold protein SufB
VQLIFVERLAGVAVDAVFDSVSVATTFKGKLHDVGVIFCPISEALLGSIFNCAQSGAFIVCQ